MDWVEVVVPATAAEVDEIAALLADDVPEAATGTEIRGDEVVFWAALDRGEDVLALTRAAVARLAESGSTLDVAGVRLQTAVPEAEWRDAWKRYFHVTRITTRIVVVPSWETYTAVEGDVVLDLDPGMAFGTGTHASTKLCLAALDRLATAGVRPDRFLDVGAGSGILAIAAAKLWPEARGIAIDNDPIAVAACLENCATNRVGDRVASSVTAVDDVDGEFPLVLANIQAHVLLALREALTRRVAAGGTLVLSGLLAQAEGVAADYVAGGLIQVELRPDGDDPQWSSAVLRRP